MATNGYSGHNGDNLSGQHGHRHSENLSTLYPEMFRHISDPNQDFESRLRGQRLHSTSSIDGNSRLEKLLKDLVSLNVENRMELRRIGSKMEDFVSTVNNKLSRMEENISRAWMDVHDYGSAAPAPGPGVNVRSPVYFRRECGPTIEEREMINGVVGDVGTGGRALGVTNIHCAASKNRGGMGQEMTDMPDISRDVYPFTSNGITRINQAVAAVYNNTNRGNPVLLPVSLDRRQSDSTTITTLESGYCGEELSENSNGDNVFYDNQLNSSYDLNIDRSSSGCQPGMGGTDNKESYDCNDDTRNCSSLIRVDDPDIMFVEEVLNAKKSGLTGSQNSGVTGVATSKDGMQNSRIRGRRPSIFSSGFHTSGSQLYDTDFGDIANDKTVRNQSQHSKQISLEEDISDVNDIFETATPTMDERTTSTVNTPSSSPPMKRIKSSGNISNNELKRIRGISKAPIKREPGTLSIYSSRSGLNTPSNTPPPTMPESFMETINNIKKERVAHAVDRFEAPFDIMDERGGVWRCICGHSTNTKNGMKLHVKNNGTDEARYKCPKPDCQQRFLFPFLVRNHVLKDHKDNSVPDKLFGCDKCFNIFEDKNCLRTHVNERNEICKSTPRRRSYPSRNSRGERPVAEPPLDPETSNRPSIIITL